MSPFAWDLLCGPRLTTVMTALDGCQLARKGRAGPTLGMAAIASFIAGTFGTIGLMVAAPTLASVAIAFGPPEYFALVVMGLIPTCKKPDLLMVC